MLYTSPVSNWDLKCSGTLVKRKKEKKTSYVNSGIKQSFWDESNSRRFINKSIDCNCGNKLLRFADITHCLCVQWKAVLNCYGAPSWVPHGSGPLEIARFVFTPYLFFILGSRLDSCFWTLRYFPWSWWCSMFLLFSRKTAEASFILTVGSFTIN